MDSLSPSISRRWLLALAALAFGTAAAPRNRPVNVLFVCEAGTVKSPIAREHMRRLVREHGAMINVQSRGIAPENHMTPELAAALMTDGIDVTREPARKLAIADLQAADVIVIFNPLPAALGVWPVRDWTDVPSMNQDYAASRAILIPRLGSLMSELEK